MNPKKPQTPPHAARLRARRSPLGLALLFSAAGLSGVFGANQYFDPSVASGLNPGTAVWDAGVTDAWANTATPGTTAPGKWTDGNDAFFQTGGANVVTLSGSITARSLTQVSGTTTLAGSGTLAIVGGTVSVNAGSLVVGSGTGGALPSGASVVLASGANLNFARTDATTWSGSINGTATTAGIVSRTGTGNLTLTLQGNNAFGVLTNTNASGRLLVATQSPTDQVNALLRAGVNCALSVGSGVWITPNLGIGSTGAQMRGTLSITNASVSVTDGRFVTGNYVVGSGALLSVLGNRFGYNNEQTLPTASLNLTDEGELNIFSTQYGASIGGGTNANVVTLFTQSGGTARFGADTGTSGTNRNLVIGATAAGSKSAYDLSGGALLVAGTLSGGTGFNNFNFRGGVLAANAINTALLGYSTDTANPVANTTSVGTLVNRGGTLAPGDLGLAGKTAITGNYTIQSGSLAIDISGITPATTFQNTAPGQHDQLSVSGSVTLGGTLALTRIDGFVPSAADTFTLLTAGSVSGGFTNIASGSRLACLPSGSFLVTVTSTGVSLSAFQPGPGPAIASAPVSTSTVVGSEVYLSVVVASPTQGTVTYQWRKNGVPISGATSAQLYLTNTTAADAGAYDVVVTDISGSRTSAAGNVTVAPAGQIDPLVAASAYSDKTVWSYHSSSPVPWSLFAPRDYGSSSVAFDGQGVTSFGRVPAPGIHPRIFFSPEDLPELRRRVRETTGGQEAWKNLLCYSHYLRGTYDQNQDYALPHWSTGFGIRSRNPHLNRFKPVNSEDYLTVLANGGTPQTFAANPSYFFKIASTDALRCLVDEDVAGAQKLALATVRTVQLEQARRALKDTPVAAGQPPKPSTPRSDACALGLVYDFIYNYMTPAQRDFVREELVLLSSWADNYGTFNKAETSRSNWATFSYWAIDLMAIEGEPGFNDLKFLGLYRGWRNYYTYGVFESGAAFEAEGKFPVGLDSMIAFDRVGWKYGLPPLTQHPMLRAYFTKFLPQSTMPTRNGKFVLFDILGAMGGLLTTPADVVAAKFLYPGETMVDFTYRALVNDNYSNIPSAIHYHWNEQILSTLTATSHSLQSEPGLLNAPKTFFCGDRSVLLTRSSWDAEATLFTMHVRGASGGHAYADRNSIMLSGKGRAWITTPGKDIGSWSMNTVLIDGAQQSISTPGRVVDYVDQPNATFLVGDSKYSWDWDWSNVVKDKQDNLCDLDDVLSNNLAIGASGWSLLDQTPNTFSYEPSSAPFMQEPLKFRGSWIDMKGVLHPMKRMVNNPVLKSFRTAGLVRGARPYVLVVDDIQRDSLSATYNWNATLPVDVVRVTAGTSGQPGDLFFAGQASLATDGSLRTGEPGLLLRILDHQGELIPATLIQRDPQYKHLAIAAEAVAPNFKIMLYPFRMGDPLPATTWDANRTTLAIAFPGQSDSVEFSASASGKTNVVVSRSGSTLAAVNKAVAPLNDPASDAFSPALVDVASRYQNLVAQNYAPAQQSGFLAGWEFDQVQTLPGGGDGFVPVPGSIPEATPISATGIPLVAGMNGASAAGANQLIATPLSWGSRLANGFTIAFWMKMDVRENANLFDFGYVNNASTNRILLLRHRGGLGLAALSNWYLDGGSASMITSWTHLVAVFTGTQLNIYRNGFLVSTYPATPSQFAAFTQMRLGPYQGAVQSVYFYNTGFSAEQVKDLFVWGRYSSLADF